jgi:hypothetical protein
VWTALGWQEESDVASLVGAAMCSPCERGSHDRGHNALRGSGPGQNPAFDNAVALVGCPDRRIDRLCITCCSPSQPSHPRQILARSRSCRERGWFLVVLAPGHHGPRSDRSEVGRTPPNRRGKHNNLCARGA